MKNIVTYVLSGVAVLCHQCNAQNFRIDDIAVGSQSINYVDPEFSSHSARMVFYSTTDVPRIWLAYLNPLNGTLVSGTGSDLLIDSSVATLGPSAQTNNGPEWGLDRAGEAIFYSKADSSGVVQYWRAAVQPSSQTFRIQLTHVPSPNGEGAIQGVVRTDATLPHTMFFYRYSTGPENEGLSRWADESNPDQVNNIQYFNAGAFAPSFIPGTEDIAFSRFTSQSTSEVFRLSTSTNTYTQISNEPHTQKSSIVAFHAPEYGNELMYAYVADKRELVILRENGSGFRRFAVLNPGDTVHPHMYSPEIFQVNGITYFAVLMQNAEDYHSFTDGAVYVLGFGDDTRRLVRRVDEGTPMKRIEPEVFVGSNEVFVFYNTQTRLRRCRTGILLSSTEIADNRDPRTARFELYQNYPNPFNPETVISYQLSTLSQVSVKVFDALGKEVAVLVDEQTEPGFHHLTFNAFHSSLTSGVYFYQVRAGSFVQTKKMLVIK